MSAQLLLIQNLKAPPLTYKAILPYDLEGQLVSQDGGVAVGNVGEWPCVYKHWGTLHTMHTSCHSYQSTHFTFRSIYCSKKDSVTNPFNSSTYIFLSFYCSKKARATNPPTSLSC